MKGTRTPKEATKRDEKKPIKQSQKEQKDKTFNIESLFNASRSGILMEIKGRIPVDYHKPLK